MTGRIARDGAVPAGDDRACLRPVLSWVSITPVLTVRGTLTWRTATFCAAGHGAALTRVPTGSHRSALRTPALASRRRREVLDLKLEYFHVPVADMAAAVAFYAETLGLEEA